MLGLLHIIFRTFVPELWPLIYAKIWFRSLSLEQIDRISPNFIYKIYVGIFTHHFSHFCTRVVAIDLRQNFVSIQYFENKWPEFLPNLYMHLY